LVGELIDEAPVSSARREEPFRILANA
jgi:hypothetical protein